MFYFDYAGFLWCVSVRVSRVVFMDSATGQNHERDAVFG